jgi:glycosyltransferase involved in cell wall biosynthesis
MQTINRLSVIIPVYNEATTIITILDQIQKVELLNKIQKEIVIVNDCSSDLTGNRINEYLANQRANNFKYIKHERNMGKGACIHTGLQHATGDYIIVQDADLEYDPQEYNLLLPPVLKGVADVVYGSRFVSASPHRTLFFWHSVGNKFLTFLSNALTDLNLTDMETCYKLLPAELLRKVKLKEKGFGFEPEVTAKISKVKGIRIYEVGISYYGRTYDEGKKINWRDGVRAIYCILKYNLTRKKQIQWMKGTNTE